MYSVDSAERLARIMGESSSAAKALRELRERQAKGEDVSLFVIRSWIFVGPTSGGEAMIRDPSDGSVREEPVDEKPASVSTRNELPSDDNALMSPTTSGLPLAKPGNVAKLDKSREWLTDYRRKQNEERQRPDPRADEGHPDAEGDMEGQVRSAEPERSERQR